MNLLKCHNLQCIQQHIWYVQSNGAINFSEQLNWLKKNYSGLLQSGYFASYYKKKSLLNDRFPYICISPNPQHGLWAHIQISEQFCNKSKSTFYISRDCGQVNNLLYLHNGALNGRLTAAPKLAQIRSSLAESNILGCLYTSPQNCHLFSPSPKVLTRKSISLCLI